MRKSMVITMVAFTFIMQSCSDSTTERIDLSKGSLSNDESTIVINEKGHFICDFHWTEGYEIWNYGLFGAEPVGNNKTKAPWCLIPYGETTKFSFSTNKDGIHYVCKDKKNESFYEMMRTSNADKEIAIVYDDSDKRIMDCVTIENPVTVTASGDTNNGLESDLPLHRDDMLYHVIELKGRYSIEGHLNLRLVKSMKLSVRLAFVNASGVHKSVDNNKKEMVDSLTNYMEKAGYNLTINSNNILYTDDIMEVNRLGTQYSYVIGIMYNTRKKEKISDDPRVLVISDGNDFFSADAKTQARLLAALLYSKILGKDPLNVENENYLSSYAKNLDFSQPSNDWKEGRYKTIQQGSLLEFASIIPYFMGEQNENDF